jgi:hypothetical protein
VQRITAWKGLAQLRAVYATRYPLIDGPEPAVEGLRSIGLDPEQVHFEREAQETDRRLLEYRREVRLAIAEGDPHARQLAAIREGRLLGAAPIADHSEPVPERTIASVIRQIPSARVQQSRFELERELKAVESRRRSSEEHAHLVAELRAQVGGESFR